MFNDFLFNEKVFDFVSLVEDTKEDLNYYIKYNDYFLHD
jgi:hypothetical protein